MTNVAGAKITKSSKIQKFDPAGNVIEEIDFSKGLREKERKARVAFQKGLFDISLNLGPIFQGTKKEDKDVIRMAQLQAEESDFSDQFDGVYTAFHLLLPPVDPKSLVHISQRLSIIDPIIDSMKTNIEGFGQIFVDIMDFDDPEVKDDLKDHFSGRLLHEMETDGIERIRKLYEKDQQVKITKSADHWYDLLNESIAECVDILKHRPIEDEEDLDISIRAYQNSIPEFVQKHAERIEKIRSRTFTKRMAAMKLEKKDEHKFLKNFFTNANCKMSWMQIRKRLRDDFERIGAWSMEVMRNKKNRRPVQLGHVPQVDVRLTRLGDPIKAAMPCRINEIEIIEEVRPVRFRKFVQALGRTGRFIWFKDFGDPRIMDRNTGLFVGEYIWNPTSKEYDQVYYRDFDKKLNKLSYEQYLETNPGFVEANDLLFHSRYNAIGSPYPVPRWFGCLTLAQGMIAMEEVNASWFDNNLVPPMIVKVADGNLSKKSEARIRGIFEDRRGREKQHSILVLEAESQYRARNFANTGKPIIEIEKMRDTIQQDATHTQYDEKGRLKLRACWRLPPAHVGQESQYTRQSINASKVAAEEQVFQPERHDFDDVINKHLMIALGINHWRFKSNSPPVADNLQMAQVLSTLGKAGFLTVGEARPEVEMILNRPLAKFREKDLTDVPFPLVLIEAKAQTRGNKGPQDDAPENPQNKMGGRPDKDGFVTDSEVVKSQLLKSGIRVGQVVYSSLEQADDRMLALVQKSGGCYVQEENGLYFVTRDAQGRLMSFRQADRKVP